LVQDAVVDEAGFTVKRPGLSTYVDLGITYGVDGLYWWTEQEAIIAVCNGRVFKIVNGTATELTGSTALLAGNQVSFDTDGTRLLMAAGSNIVHTTLAGPLTTMADADAPTTVKKVLVYDQYAVAPVVGSSQFAWSEVGNTTAWRALDIATAEAKPDRIVTALGTLDGFVLFGDRSTEFWINDGVSPFQRVQGLTFDRGCSAQYSPALLGDTWLWLDERRRVVRATTNDIKEVSESVDRELQNLSSVEDAIGHIQTVEGWPLYVLTFPLANRTLVYNLKSGAWQEWGQWNSAQGVYQRFRGQSYCYAAKLNLHLWGDRSNGIIYKMNRSTFDDGGAAVRSVRRTGFITHGTLSLKRCKRIRLRIKRGVATDAVPNPTMQVRWREQGGAWGNTHTLNVSLGAVGQHDLMVELRLCGSYRARQYEFIHSDATDWVLMGGEEEVEVATR
jgi:hypothetical protein